MKHHSHFLTLFILVTASAVGAEPPGGRELIPDNLFQRGFVLLEPKPGKQVPYGTLRGWAKDADPVWKLAQWSSRFPLKAAEPEILQDGALCYRNEARSVVLGAPGTPRADISLRVNTQPEYGNHVRQKGEPWVHLLLEQPLDKPPVISELEAVNLHLEARLLESKKFPMPGYSPHLHAAQFQVFLTVQNLNRQSPGYGKYLWFGIPVYDDRQRIPVAHKTKDTGGTDMFIFTAPGETFTTVSTHDGMWVTIEKDLLPLMREASRVRPGHASFSANPRIPRTTGWPRSTSAGKCPGPSRWRSRCAISAC